MSKRRANIAVANGRVFVVTCRNCGRQWEPYMRRPMGRRWWECPSGCNADAYERTTNEVARHEAAHQRSILAARVLKVGFHPLSRGRRPQLSAIRPALPAGPR